MKTNAGIRPQAGQVWVCRDGRTLEPDFLVAGDIGGVSAGLVPFGGATGGLATAAGFSFNSGTNALAAPGAVAAVGAISTTDTTASSSTTTGSGKFAGGVGVVGNVWVGGTLNVAGTSTLAAVDATSIGATTPGTGAFTTLTASGAATFTNATASSSSSTGAVIITGGLGIGGDVFLAGDGSSQGSKLIGSPYGLLIRHRGYGYSPSTYTAVQISQAAHGVGFGVDPLSITGGQFTGDSTDIFFTRGAVIGSPNAGATDWVWALKISGGSTSKGAPAVTIADASVAFASGFPLTISDTTASTSTTTGALVVSGGAGFAGNINVGGTTTSIGRYNVSLSDANTSTATNFMVVDHASSGTPAAGFGSQLLVRASSSTTANRNQALFLCEWATATDASRAGRMSLWAYDSGGPREGMRVEASGTAPMLGVLGSSAVVKQTVTGSRGANAALASLITAMAAFGFVTDSST